MMPRPNSVLGSMASLLLTSVVLSCVGSCAASGIAQPAPSSSPTGSAVRSTLVSSVPDPSNHGSPDAISGPAAPIRPTTAGESMVWVSAGDHRVPGTLALPALLPGHPAPAVLLLHGDLSHRDENGDMFARLAAALSARGIASLRIDFAGSGDSDEPDLDLDYPGMVHDATAALTYLQGSAALDPDRLAIVGLSRGGSIAATVAGTVPGVAALVSWSGAISNGVDEDPDAHQQARDNGYVPVELGDREFRLSLAWFDTIEASHPLDDVAGYTGHVLAVDGSNDDIVPNAVSENFIATVASADKILVAIDGADHGFTAEPEYGDEAIAVTADWLADRLR